MCVVCCVEDRFGNPIPAVLVEVGNNSGGNGASTDGNGIALLHMGELEVDEVKVNHVTVVSRPNAYWLNSPNVEHGLNLRIVVKSKAEFGL